MGQLAESRGVVVVLLETPICDVGKQAVDFDLLGVDGRQHSLADTKGQRGLLVMFICNHCPYVKAIQSRLTKTCADLEDLGVGSIAIMSNDASGYPEDSYENMQRISREFSYPFPYLLDEDGEVARAYGAVCTPDFFGYNSDLLLQYRGRFDNQAPNYKVEEPLQHDLLEAMREMAHTGSTEARQYPSMGCSIKF